MSDFVSRARALEADIIAARPEMDRLRRLPDDLAAKFREAQFYRLCMPKAHGGLEAEPRVVVETIEALAEADASAGWCVTVSATTGAFGAYLDARDRERDLHRPGADLCGRLCTDGQGGG